MIASRTKRKQMFVRLQSRGISDEALARVEAPVGIPIGSESPAECAVSILGGIIRHHKLGTRPAVGDRRDEHDRAHTQTALRPQGL